MNVALKSVETKSFYMSFELTAEEKKRAKTSDFEKEGMASSQRSLAVACFLFILTHLTPNNNLICYLYFFFFGQI